jgi:hypothetical protein
VKFAELGPIETDQEPLLSLADQLGDDLGLPSATSIRSLQVNRQAPLMAFWP